MSASAMDSIMGFVTGPGLLIIMMVALIALMIVPQRRREKKVKEMLGNIKVGDHIRTIGGFYGQVVQVKDDFFVIEIPPDNTRVTIARGAVSTVENSDVENEAIDEKKS